MVKAVLADLVRERECAGAVDRDRWTPRACRPARPPPIPAATNPPGASYGVPFLAAVTNGQVLAGYDEWTANHLVWTAGNETFNLYPWQSKIYDITGWVTGLLQLPSLTAQIAPQDVVFCDNQGGASCLSATGRQGSASRSRPSTDPSPASRDTAAGPRQLSPRRGQLQRLLDPDVRVLPLRGEPDPLRDDLAHGHRSGSGRRTRSNRVDRSGHDGERGAAAAVDFDVHLPGLPPPP